MGTASGDNAAGESGTAEIVRSGQPFFWRVAEGMLYAEMSLETTIRPPLLTEWESERVRAFRNPRRRRQWLAGRALAKALVRERLRIDGIVEIREGSCGEPLVYRGGMPLTDVWLSMVYRHGRVAAIIADRPAALEIKRVDDESARLVERFVRKRELRSLEKVFERDPALVRSAAWAIKEAAVRARRISPADLPDGLGSVELCDDLGVIVDDVRMHAMAVRVVKDTVVAVVARPLLHEEPVTRVVTNGRPEPEPRAAGFSAAVERSVARSRRLAEARARFHRLRWQQ